MAKLLVVADDYTGALDTGAQFTECGARVVVTDHVNAIGPRVLDEVGDGEVLAVDAGTRNAAPDEAAARVGEIVRLGVRHGFTHFYKKTDSALRGNIGAELAAALEAAGESSLAFAPAYPKNGRVTSDGVHYVDGTPVGESVFARDPFSPVKRSDVSGIIKGQTDVRVACYGTGAYGGGDGKNVPVIARCKTTRQSSNYRPTEELDCCVT